MGRKPNWERFGKCGVKEKEPTLPTFKEYKKLVKRVPAETRFSKPVKNTIKGVDFKHESQTT